MKTQFFSLLLLSVFLLTLISCEDEGGMNGKKNRAPAAPTTPTPANGATNIDTTVTFSWTCSDPDDDDLTYKFLISTDNVTFYRLNPAYFSSPSLTIASGLAFNTTYFWKIKAFDSRDSSQSAIWQFTTRSNPPQLSISPTNLNFGTSATQQTFNITNTGGGSLSWSVTDDRTWISVSPTSGTTTTETDQITVTVNRGSLSAGSYSGTVTVTPNIGNPITIPVTIEVEEFSPQLYVSPTSLDFGTSTTQRTFNITNTGGGSLSWSNSDDRNWITVSPTSGSTTTETDQITVTVSRSGLSTGSYSGTITVTPTVGSAQTVSVSMQVASSLAFTINNPLYTDMIVQVDGFSSRTVSPGSSTTYNYSSNPGSVHYYAYTSGTTTSGTQVGLKMEWEEIINSSAYTSISRNLIYTSTYFFLKITNNVGAHVLSPIYVNYGLTSQTIDNVVLNATGSTYYIGYYRAYSNTQVRAYFYSAPTSYVYWNQGTHFNFPWTNNQSVTLSNSYDKIVLNGEPADIQQKPEYLYQTKLPKLNPSFKDAKDVYCK